MPTAISDAAQQLLARLAGPDAVLRDDQAAAIDALVTHAQRVLVVQATGWGKSAVYFIATALLRAAGAGPTLLVSPLLALMRDQIGNARRVGIRAETINSANLEEWAAIEARLATGDVDLLCISPERLNSPGFRDDILPRLAGTVGLLVVDEAHCVSDWGHDFRPDYRRIRDFLARLGDTPVLACTATANDRVVVDIADQLGHDPVTLRGCLERESLALSVVRLEGAARLQFLADTIPTLDGSGIVYTLTVAETERVAAFLRDHGVDAAAYSGDTPPEERERIEADLKANRLKAVVATSALGMGFDKPDVAFAVHYGMPSSPIAYYQQVGRAGRALPRAVGILLPGPEDRRIWEFFGATSFPPERLVRDVLDRLGDAGGDVVSLTALEQGANLGRGRLEAMLKVLDVDGAVERVRGGYRATGRPWRYDAERFGRLAAARRAEQDAMLAYAATDGCRMGFLRAQLDDPALAAGERCGRCDNCTGVSWEPPADSTAAREFLRTQDTPIPARRAWPRGLSVVRGNIPPGRRAEEGRALAVAGDAGWAPAVAPILDGGEPLSEEVLAGFARMLGRWGWQARPTWVTYLPSRARPGLVEALADGVGRLGKLPVHPVLVRVAQRPPQAQMGNSAHQLSNVWGAWRVEAPAGALPGGPVLLVDDEVRSGWTLSVATALLRDAGTGPVLPAVLRKAR